MRWSSAVLPEPAMIPDLSVFLRTASASSQAVTAGGRCHTSLPHVYEVREALFGGAQGKVPALLKLPFILLPPGEDKILR